MRIFLDIDGVLNKESQWSQPYSLDADCIREFCQYAKEVKGEIILISSWRAGFLGTKNEKNTKQIKRLETQLAIYGISIADKTPELPGRTRDKEIERYLYFHPGKDYIILDDDRKEYSEAGERNYFVDAATGFTGKDRVRCRKKRKLFYC